ncbi:MAG: hypothetical protein WCQ82_08955 [Bacteroidaceae bacterium]|nr:hypothetical protein [Bacteroidaceae bacterium]
MKKLSPIFSSIITISILIACGGDTVTSNKYLGEYPSMVKSYYNKKEKKAKEVKECTDMQQAFKLSKEEDALKEKAEKKIKEHLELHPIVDTELPFTAIDNAYYTLTKVVVNKSYPASLNLKFIVNIKQDITNKYGGIEKRLFLYYKAIDSAGNDIAGTKTVATNFKRIELKAGLNYEVFGTWKGSSVANLEDFAKVVEITEQEYKEKK